MTIQEFADFFNVGTSTAHRLVLAQEALPAESRTLRIVRLGKRIGIVRSDAMALAANGGKVETLVAS